MHEFAEEDQLEDSEEYYNQRGPSKSSRKRSSSALQDLGADLMALTSSQLVQLDLPEELLEAVRTGQGITAHGGLLRQRKYIGKLLRGMDTDPIRQGLIALKGETVQQIRLQHQCECWRDRMIEEGDPGVNAFVGDYPQAERQKLRQWVRDARRERETQQPPRSARLLFRYLKEIMASVSPFDHDEPLAD